MDSDEFLDDNGSSGMGIRGFNETWVQYILEFPMPSVEDEKRAKLTIIKMLEPVVNTAARSNLTRTDVRLALWEYDNIWTSYFVYERRGRKNADLIMLKRCLKAGFNLMLRRSIEMGQMRMIFEPKQSIFQRLITSREKKIGFFKNKKEQETNELEGER